MLNLEYMYTCVNPNSVHRASSIQVSSHTKLYRKLDGKAAPFHRSLGTTKKYS